MSTQAVAPPIDTRREVRALTRLAVPAVLTQIGYMLLGVVDVVMVGRYSSDALAAASLAHLWVMAWLVIGMGVIFGMDPMVSQGFGARDRERMGRALQYGTVVGFGLVLPVAVAFCFTERFLLLAGQDPELAKEAHRYAMIQIPTLPCALLYNVLRQYLQGRGILRPALWVAIVANVFNILMNWVLIFGKFGAPELGLAGAAIATSTTRAFQFFGLLGLVYWAKLWRGAWVPWSRHAFSIAGWGQVVRLGFPVSVQLALEFWFFSACSLIAGKLGTLSLAAHTIALNMASLTFMVPLGISIAVTTRVGNLLGAGQPLRAQRTAWVAMAMGASLMSLFGISFWLLANHLPGLYSEDPAVIALCSTILPIAGLFQIFDGTQVIGGGILRGMGNSRPAALFNLFGFYLLALPLAHYLARVRNLGLTGVWWGVCLGLSVVAVCYLVWIRRRGPASLALDTTPRPVPGS